MKLLNIFFGCCLLFFNKPSFAQTIPFNSEDWEINARGHLFNAYKGNQVIHLKNGIAWLKDVEFQNGIIEFDVYMEEQRSFSGILFRLEDASNYEEIYLRPHLNGKPDAMQYTPVNNGAAAWQLYHDQGRPVFDGQIGWRVETQGGYNALFHFPYGRWFHLKLVVAGTRADLYLDNQPAPILQIRTLKRGLTSGSIGIKSGRGASYFANFSYQKTDEVALTELPALKTENFPKNIIPAWQVSSTFNEKEVKGKHILNSTFLTNKNWQTLKSEDRGVINISSLHKGSREQNTVLTKVILQSTRDQIKRIDFGYSDRVHLFCNNQLIYSGNNGYRTRDYRFLGSIGYFDSVYLPLKKGANEVILAVSESFGGWGIQAKLENLEGIQVTEK